MGTEAAQDGTDGAHLETKLFGGVLFGLARIGKAGADFTDWQVEIWVGLAKGLRIIVKY
jgi:hypothetical protein